MGLDGTTVAASRSKAAITAPRRIIEGNRTETRTFLLIPRRSSHPCFEPVIFTAIVPRP